MDEQEEESMQAAVAYLATLAPGRLPLPVFQQVARLVVLPTIEYMPMRRSPVSGAVEVLLTQRPPTDPWWPGLWHNPGTVLLASDAMEADDEYGDAEERVFGEAGELRGEVERLADAVMIRTERRATTRGHEISIIFGVLVSGEPTVGKFFAIDDLPDDIIPHQIPSIIQTARVLFPG